MVSHPDVHDRAQSSRRAPSVAPSVASSSASTVRRHHHSRHSRSHHGGGGAQNQNEFPVFTHTGDVEIVISSASGRKQDRYLLHRLILSQCSGFFEAGMSDEWAAAGGADSSRSVRPGRADSHQGSSLDGQNGQALVHKRKWRYELDWGNKEGDLPILVQKDSPASMFGGDSGARPPPIRPKPPAPTTGFFRQMSNISSLHISSSAPQQTADDEILRDYANLFRIFYNYPPALDTVNIANAYVECKTLLALADMYDALDVIGPRVDHHLLRFQGRLWKQIAKYPPSYLKLGYLARSKAIFSEAIVHVVGQWPNGQSQLRGQVPEGVMDLILDKVDELDETKAKVEGKLFRLTLTTSRGERVNPSNSWLDWLVMSLFRQWIAENTTPAPASILKPPSSGRGSSRQSSQRPPAQPPPPVNTGRIFRLLGAGSSAYLSHDEMKRFLKLTPEQYSRENLKRFERRMDELKNLARDVVKPLMRNFLELDLRGDGGGGLPYLTCTRIEERDFPWDE